MGYVNDTPPDARVMEEVSLVMAHAARVAQPKFCYQVMKGELSIDHSSLLLADTRLEVGTVIGKQLDGSEAFALFVATAGEEFERWRQRLKDMVHIYMADAIGSLVAERCADEMESTLQANIDKLSWHHTNRFSPGYCGWDVSNQHALFSLFGEKPCGVTLSEHSLMIPIKSVSGVIGIGANVKKHPYTCSFCNHQNCFRRKGKG